MKLRNKLLILSLFLNFEICDCSQASFVSAEGTHTVPIWDQDIAPGASKMHTFKGGLGLSSNNELVTRDNHPVLGRWMGTFAPRNTGTLYNNFMMNPVSIVPDQKCIMTSEDLEKYQATAMISISAHFHPADFGLHEKTTSIILQNGVLWDLKFLLKQEKGTHEYKMNINAKDPTSSSWQDDIVYLVKNNNKISHAEGAVSFEIPFYKPSAVVAPFQWCEPVRILFKDHDPLWTSQLMINLQYSTFGSRPFDWKMTRDGQAQIHTLEYKAPYLEIIRGDQEKERIFEALGATYLPQ